MPQSIADTTTVTLGRAILAYHGKLETFAAKSRREDLKQQLVGVEMALDRCRHDYKYVPPSKFEARNNKWVKLSFRTCRICGQVCENVDAEPGKSLGTWTQLKT